MTVEDKQREIRIAGRGYGMTGMGAVNVGEDKQSQIKWEVIENKIIFNVETDRSGKWAIIHALTQVLDFWKTVSHYAVFRRQAFGSIVIEITRDRFMENIREKNLSSTTIVKEKES